MYKIDKLDCVLNQRPNVKGGDKEKKAHTNLKKLGAYKTPVGLWTRPKQNKTS